MCLHDYVFLKCFSQLSRNTDTKVAIGDTSRSIAKIESMGQMLKSEVPTSPLVV